MVSETTEIRRKLSHTHTERKKDQNGSRGVFELSKKARTKVLPLPLPRCVQGESTAGRNRNRNPPENGTKRERESEPNERKFIAPWKEINFSQIIDGQLARLGRQLRRQCRGKPVVCGLDRGGKKLEQQTTLCQLNYHQQPRPDTLEERHQKRAERLRIRPPSGFVARVLSSKGWGCCRGKVLRFGGISPLGHTGFRPSTSHTHNRQIVEEIGR